MSRPIILDSRTDLERLEGAVLSALSAAYLHGTVAATSGIQGEAYQRSRDRHIAAERAVLDLLADLRLAQRRKAAWS